MEATQQKYLVKDLLELRQNNMLAVNAEYQRGAVWSLDQKKKLIDSIFRGYPIPIIYLNKIKRQVGTHSRDDLEIIDGQQRLNALHEYYEGAFPLYDPLKEFEKARFPAFIKEMACEWGGKTYQELPEDLRKEFAEKSLIIAEITKAEENEVRDLFVRLQAGSALNAQEQRDAWPGGFTDFILQVGGKPAITRYPGHKFYKETLKMKPGSDRGKTRQLAAQMFVLFENWRKTNGQGLDDTNASVLNSFYYDHLDFDPQSQIATDFAKRLSKVSELLAVESLTKLRGHDAIHAVLLCDTLARSYESLWEKKFGAALAMFLKGLALGKKENDDGKYSEYWSQYGQLTRVNSDRGENIMKRHVFYQKKMLEFMQPLSPKDATRGFGEIDRSVLFYEQDRKCQVCKDAVLYDEMEVHHIHPHSNGGKTSISNGAIVHPQCHPKSNADVVAFRERRLAYKEIEL